MDRKKKLKEQYKNMKPDMGVYCIKANFTNKCLMEYTQDLKSTINGSRFRLNAGNHLNTELQKDWIEHGEDSFTIEVLEVLQYDKDESKTDYSEDLQILKMIWEERLSEKDMELY